MIILSGTNSVIAKYLIPILRDRYQVCSFDQDMGDISDPDFLQKLVSQITPELFINCKEFGNIEEAEYKREEAYHVNSYAPGNIAKLCKEKNGFLIHFSSSFVYDSSKNIDLTEKSPLKPTNVYGDSKLFGENKINETGCKSCILRVPYVYGDGYGIVADIIKKIKSNQEIKIIKGQIISSLYADDIAQILMNILDKKNEGVFNLANSGAVSIKDFIHQVKKGYEKYSGKNFGLNLCEFELDDFESAVDWPIYCNMNLSKIIDTTLIKPRSWQEALDDYLQKNFEIL